MTRPDARRVRRLTVIAQRFRRYHHRTTERSAAMKITLAYPFEGHEPDSTIEVDDAVGRRMIRDGRARHADIGPDSKVGDLRAYAERHDIDLTGKRSKEEILAALETAEQTRSSAVSVRSPVPPVDES